MNDSTILITGGTGSFGSAVLAHLLVQERANKVVVFSRDEAKQEMLRRQYAGMNVGFIVGDVRSYQSVSGAIRAVGADCIFHAAAMKDVPTCEANPYEAVLTNVEGTANVLRAASNNGVEKVVILSTDKAVYPTGTMGMTKALAEKLALFYARTDPEMVVNVTRFANIIGSRGSVIPFFIQQIKSGQPITLTDGRASRFMMTMDDAVGLVLRVFDSDDSGLIYIPKPPVVTMSDLAVVLTEIFGVEPRVRVIGLRLGERMHEWLFSDEEAYCAEHYEDHCVIGPERRQAVVKWSGSDVFYRPISRDALKELLMKQDFIQAALR